MSGPGGFRLAQANLARMRGPLESPLMEGPILVLWWIPAGRLPNVEEAREKLRVLGERGPSAEAFTFRQPFPAPGQTPTRAPEVDAEFCGGA